MADSNLARPLASFVFNPREFVVYTFRQCLTTYGVGKLFTEICRALDRKDAAYLRQFPSFIGRVYYRDAPRQRESIVPSVRRAVLDRDGRACVECGAKERLEIDHFVPYSKGGTHAFVNLRVLCKPCNRRKAAKMPAVN